MWVAAEVMRGRAKHSLDNLEEFDAVSECFAPAEVLIVG
jgi:hypothetical protein